MSPVYCGKISLQKITKGLAFRHLSSKLLQATSGLGVWRFKDGRRCFQRSKVNTHINFPISTYSDDSRLSMHYYNCPIVKAHKAQDHTHYNKLKYHTTPISFLHTHTQRHT